MRKRVLNITFLGTVFVCAVLIFSCGSSTTNTGSSFDPSKSILDDNEVTGWTEKVTAIHPDGIETFTPDTVESGYINGGAIPFKDRGMVAVYVDLFGNGALEILIEVWDMGNATNAESIYDYIIPTLSGTKTDKSVGDEGTLVEGATVYELAFRWGKYFIRIQSSDKDSSYPSHMEAMAAAITG